MSTLTEWQAGNIRTAFVIAIDGYPHLLSNAPQTSVQAAWAGTDWATKSVLSGITFDLENHQQIDPWNPFAGGGRCIIKVQPDADDTFGIDLARSDAGAETILEETADRKTALYVGYIDGFSALFEAHCGTECFGYGLIAGRRFWNTLGTVSGSMRGKYVAHGVKDSTATYGAVRFAEHHRVATQDNGVRFAPIISEHPRAWRGRRVSVWAHTYDPATESLNSKSDALCVFLGELTEPQDDSDTGNAHVLCEHLLERIPKTMLGREQWQATVDYGMQLKAGQTFKFSDDNDTSTRTANDLVVVESGASGTNQIDAGLWAPEEVVSAINAWLGGESAAGRIHGSYTFVCPEDVSGTPRTVAHYFVAGTTSTKMWFRLEWPFTGWARSLGYPFQKALQIIDSCGAGHATPSPQAVRPFDFVGYDSNNTFRIALENQTGTFQGQNGSLPAAAAALIAGEQSQPDYGLFMLECESPMLLLGTVDGNTLRRVRPLNSGFGFGVGGYEALLTAQIPVGAAPPRLRQVFVHEAKMKTFLKWLFCSTGTEGYNHSTYDVLPHGQGLAIPWDALGTNFEHSCDSMPGADDIITVTIEKPRTVNDLFRADLVMRNAHLVFREGGFRFVSWTSPSSAVVTTTLDESNKAEPIDTRISQRSASVLDSSWVKNFVKINYNRDIGKSIGGGEDVFLAAPIIFEDATSIDDMGGIPSPVTLDLRNVYNDADQVGKGVRALAGSFGSWVTLWSRPLWRLRRSIAPTLFEGFGPGVCAAVTDPFVRDPGTGARGIVTRPGLVVGHRYRISTSPADGKIKFAGECDVIFSHNDRTFAYAPCAELDETANTGGFTAGYDGNMTLKFKAHEHSESSEDVDIANFVSGDKCKLIEIDPDDPATVDSWDVELDAVTAASNQATITAALSSPAFDANKRYRLVYDSYADTQGSQRIKSFQSGATKTIQEISPPDVYGVSPTTGTVGTPTLYDHTTLPELLANVSYGPNVGAPRDTGYDKEMALLLDNMMDHTTRRSSPSYDITASTNTSTDGWQILRVEEIYLGGILYSGSLQRYLWIAPHWRSVSTANPILVQLRVSISGYPPSGNGFANVYNATPGYTIKAPAASNSWSVMSSDTAWREDIAKAYPLGNFNGHQYAFIIIEGTQAASVRGLCQVSEGERFEV